MQQVHYYLKFSTRYDAFIDSISAKERVMLISLMRKISPTLTRTPQGKILESGECLLSVQEIVDMIGDSVEVADQTIANLARGNRLFIKQVIDYDGVSFVHIKILNHESYLRAEVVDVKPLSKTGG
ncbi:MAG: hypothetical protein ACXVCY_04480 [Pseudobdellovibrionaceae bacterium]